MKNLYLMCGVPGSGKSYWIKNNINQFKGTTKVVSRDKIRFSLLNDEDEYFSKEKEVWDLFVKEIIEGLKNYDNVIVDATHLNGPSRIKTLNAVGEYLGNVKISAIVIKAPLYTCIKRNEEREGRAFVPLSVIRRMKYQFSMPTSEEGFNDVIIINNSEKE